jgi:hypothetical protein
MIEHRITFIQKEKHMRKKLLLSTLVILYMVIGTSCKQERETNQHKSNDNNIEVPQQMTLSFQVHPNKPISNKPFTLQTIVKTGTQTVSNAKVELEVWKKGSQKKHDMIATKEIKDGIYTTTVTYKDIGQYLVVVHVTAPKGHQMIYSQFQVEAKEKSTTP